MAKNTSAGNPFDNAVRRIGRLTLVIAAAGLLSACSNDMSPQEKPAGPKPGKKGGYDPDAPSVFGEDGLSLKSLRGRRAGGILGGGDENARLPVNKYIWQGALDTLSFLPLASTDPFTGVIVTDWGSTPEAPNERFKVTAYVLNPGLSAASLKVAVYREVQTGSGLWVPAPVSAETARKLEDAILARARQIRIAAVADGSSG